MPPRPEFPGSLLKVRFEFRAVAAVIEALPEQPLDVFQVFPGRIELYQADAFRQRSGRLFRNGLQILFHDRLALLRRFKPGRPQRFDAGRIAVAHRDPEPRVILQFPVRIVHDLRIQEPERGQGAAERLSEIHIVDRRADHPAVLAPQADVRGPAFVEFRVLRHPFEPRPVPVDAAFIRPHQRGQERADGFIVRVGVRPERDAPAQGRLEFRRARPVADPPILEVPFVRIGVAFVVHVPEQAVAHYEIRGEIIKIEACRPRLLRHRPDLGLIRLR